MPFPGVRRGQLLRLRLIVSTISYTCKISHGCVPFESLDTCSAYVNLHCFSTPFVNTCGQTVSCTLHSLHVLKVGKLWTSATRDAALDTMYGRLVLKWYSEMRDTTSS
jgi:hypothetical protein